MSATYPDAAAVWTAEKMYALVDMLQAVSREQDEEKAMRAIITQAVDRLVEMDCCTLLPEWLHKMSSDKIAVEKPARGIPAEPGFVPFL